mmetsp:Transcript_8987/g.16206  ORF Transcript_8987/g.16206 Transcript_8987/m.16206 type:complete len:209 (+) Transcript_8987:78-704(+)
MTEAQGESREPEAPPMPQVSGSQIALLVVSLALHKFDIVELGYRRHLEVAYGIVQLLCLGMFYLLYTKVSEIKEGGETIKVPAVEQFGKVIQPATEQTLKDYDTAKLIEAGRTWGIGVLCVMGCYYKWGYIFPVAINLCTSAVEIVESPLFTCHVRGKEVVRPFPTKNAFGLPNMPPAPPAEQPAVEGEEKEGDKGEKQKEKEKKKVK